MPMWMNQVFLHQASPRVVWHGYAGFHLGRVGICFSTPLCLGILIASSFNAVIEN